MSSIIRRTDTYAVIWIYSGSCVPYAANNCQLCIYVQISLSYLLFSLRYASTYLYVNVRNSFVSTRVCCKHVAVICMHSGTFFHKIFDLCIRCILLGAKINLPGKKLRYWYRYYYICNKRVTRSEFGNKRNSLEVRIVLI